MLFAIQSIKLNPIVFCQSIVTPLHRNRDLGREKRKRKKNSTRSLVPGERFKVNRWHRPVVPVHQDRSYESGANDITLRASLLGIAVPGS